MLMLISISWTASYAQVGEPVKCYTQTELKAIADKMVRSHECDSLLDVTELQLQALTDKSYALQMANAAKDKTINDYKGVSDLKEGIIAGKDGEIEGLTKSLKKERRKARWLKVGWAATTVGLLVLALL